MNILGINILGTDTITTDWRVNSCSRDGSDWRVSEPWEAMKLTSFHEHHIWLQSAWCNLHIWCLNPQCCWLNTRCEFVVGQLSNYFRGFVHPMSAWILFWNGPLFHWMPQAQIALNRDVSNFEEVKKRDWSEYVGTRWKLWDFHVPNSSALKAQEFSLRHKRYSTRQWRLELLEFHWVWLKMKDIWDLTITWSPKCGYFLKFNGDIQMSKDWFQASFNHQLLFSVSLHSSSNFERKRRVAWCLKTKNNQAVWSTKLGECPHVTQICNQTMGNSMNRTWRFNQRKRY